MPIANQADHHGTGSSRSGDHPAETELLQYLEGNLTADNRSRIEKHLEACTLCFHVILSVRANEAHPFTEEELKEAQDLASWTPEQHLTAILALEKKRSERNRGHIESSHAERLPNRALRLSPMTGIKLPAYWRPLAAAAIIIFALAASFWGVRYYQTDYQIARAERLLQEQHRVFIKDARLSGGYGSSGIGELMGAEDEKKYLQQSRVHLEKALMHGEQSPRARQLLAQIFIIEKEYTRADSVLRTLEPSNKNSPELLNDLGVYYFQQQDWITAEKYFSEAINVDPKLPEARYNLALVKMQVNAKDEANAILNEYLQIEKDENWKNAAKELQKKSRQ
ncbi:MAG: tetratricopeptide repeat protein [bacterium]